MTTLTMDSVVTPELTNDSDVAFKAISGQIGIDKAQGIAMQEPVYDAQEETKVKQIERKQLDMKKDTRDQ